MKKNFLFFILIIIAFTSCIKYHTVSYSVQGTVQSDSTHTASQGVVIRLYCSHLIAKGQSHYSVSQVSETITDSQGNYIIYFKKLRNSKYRYSVDVKRSGMYDPTSYPTLGPPGLQIGNSKNSTVNLSVH